MRQALLNHHWSPILWKDGIRKSDNFLSAELCVLDFDDGNTTLKGFCESLGTLGYRAVVGITKSHQKEKDDKPACDRFRAVLWFKEAILCQHQFKQNMMRVAKCFGSDIQATDAARKYAPCLEIQAIMPGDKKLLVEPYKEKPVWLNPSHFIGEKNVPHWIKDILTQGIASGFRNATLYRAVRSLKKRLFTEEEVLGLITGSAIDLSEEEIRNTVRSAFLRS